MDVVDVIAGILMGFNCLILLPLMVYGLWLFHQNRAHQMIQHRNPLLVYIINILTITTILTERVFVAISRSWNIVHVDIWVTYFIFSIFWWALFFLFAVKVYNLYYQQQYNTAIADLSWKKDINPDDIDWYISHKKTFGNTSWLIKLGIAPYIISCAIDALFPVLMGERLLSSHKYIFDFFHAIIASMPMSIAFVIFYKARGLKDIYKIRDEILYQIIFIIICIVANSILVLILNFDPETINKWGEENILRVEWTAYVFTMFFMEIPITLLSTLYPIYLIKQEHHYKTTMLDNTVNTQSVNLSDSNNLSNSETMHDIHSSLESMNKIIADYESFKVFMSHLIQEFCTESLLFLVELIQCKHNYQVSNNYKIRVTKSFKNRDEFIAVDFDKNPFDDGKPYNNEKDKYFTYLFHSDGSIMTKLSLPLEIPKSNIVTTYKNDLYQQMLALYNKYIAEDSNYAINISYLLRSKMDGIFCNGIHSPETIFNVLDECGMEIALLLQTSFTRFLTADLFMTLGIDIITNKNNDDKIYTHKDNKSINELLNSTEMGILQKEQKIFND